MADKSTWLNLDTQYELIVTYQQANDTVRGAVTVPKSTIREK